MASVYFIIICVYILINKYCSCNENSRVILRKCCPSDMFVDVNNTCGSLYDIIGKNNSDLDYMLNSRYDYTVPLHPFGENIDLIQGFVNLSNSIDYCLDKMIEYKNGNVLSQIYIKLNKNSDEKYINDQIVNVRKCCPNGYVYDTDLHYCSNNLTFIKNEYYFIKRLYDLSSPKFLNFHIHLKECTKAVMDITEIDYDFQLIDEELHVVNKVDGIKQVFVNRSYCLDQNLYGKLIARVCRDVSLTCGKDIICVNKCCNEGQTFAKRNKLKPKCTDDYDFLPYSPKFIHFAKNSSVIIDKGFSKFGTIPNYKCPKGRYLIDDSLGDLLTANGKLYLYMEHKSIDDYCFDNVILPNKKALMKFRCFPPMTANNPDNARKENRLTLYAYGLSISCVFLLATLIVYLFLPELQNIHGKTLMGHVFSLFLGQVVLLIAQLKILPLKWGTIDICTLVGFMIIFMFLAAFSWLNIMCFDIWWTFGGTKSVGGSTRRRTLERKRFIYYNIYAWSVPALITGMCVTADNTSILPEMFRPNVGFQTCFFDFEKRGILLFFTIPFLCFAICNLVLFVLTAIHCSRVKGEIHRMQMDSRGQNRKKRFLNDRARLLMTMKLFVVMGVSWVWEAFGIRHEIWFVYIGDVFNILMGIPIFFIFVAKPKVWNLLCKRLGIQQQNRPRSVSSATTSCSNPLRIKNSISSNSSILISNTLSVNPSGK